MAMAFNYISFGDRDYISDNPNLFQMARSRMFEYTNTDFQKRLEPLNDTAIEFLKSIPAFLCSEISHGHEARSMLIQFGFIEYVNPEKRDVLARFNTLIDFGEIKFGSLEEASEVFYADKFQLYRTHWAVREGDHREILERLGELQPEFEPSVRKYLESSGGGIDTQPPPREKRIIGAASSVEEFLQTLYGFTGQKSTESFFRGHHDSSYELIPSLLRKNKDGSWKFLPSEDRLCKELLIAHYDEFQSDQYCFDRLVRMQHYGLPTRLLDISSNPLVALFFACHGGVDQFGLEGEVIVFRINSESIKYYDSDTVSCISNLSNLNFDQKNEMDLNVDLQTFNKTEIGQKLLHHIKSEKGYFEGRIIPDDLRSVVCVKAKRTNSRIKSQSGAFLLFGHEANLAEAGEEGLEIARVTITEKGRILDQLNSININTTTVYPSIDQTATHLKKNYDYSTPG